MAKMEGIIVSMDVYIIHVHYDVMLSIIRGGLHRFIYWVCSYICAVLYVYINQH